MAPARPAGMRTCPPGVARPTCTGMDDAGRALLRRTEQPRYPNGERKLARDPFTQATWVILGVAALAQLVLLAALDVMS